MSFTDSFNFISIDSALTASSSSHLLSFAPLSLSAVRAHSVSFSVCTESKKAFCDKNYIHKTAAVTSITTWSFSILKICWFCNLYFTNKNNVCVNTYIPLTGYFVMYTVFICFSVRVLNQPITQQQLSAFRSSQAAEVQSETGKIWVKSDFEHGRWWQAGWLIGLDLSQNHLVGFTETSMKKKLPSEQSSEQQSLVNASSLRRTGILYRADTKGTVAQITTH